MEVWRSDEAIDDIYNALFRELITYMMEDPRNITPCTHLLFIAKNLERIGDHATNIAEMVYYAVKGEPLPDGRPKGDSSAYAVVRPEQRIASRRVPCRTAMSSCPNRWCWWSRTRRRWPPCCATIWRSRASGSTRRPTARRR